MNIHEHIEIELSKSDYEEKSMSFCIGLFIKELFLELVGK